MFFLKLPLCETRVRWKFCSDPFFIVAAPPLFSHLTFTSFNWFWAEWRNIESNRFGPSVRWTDAEHSVVGRKAEGLLRDPKNRTTLPPEPQLNFLNPSSLFRHPLFKHSSIRLFRPKYFWIQRQGSDFGNMSQCRRFRCFPAVPQRLGRHPVPQQPLPAELTPADFPDLFSNWPSGAVTMIYPCIFCLIIFSNTISSLFFSLIVSQ